MAFAVKSPRWLLWAVLLLLVGMLLTVLVFLAAEYEVGRDQAALEQLAHPDLKTHPGPGRRLRENHGPRLASQWLVLRRRFGAPFLFQGRRQAEEFLHLTGGELFLREQVFHG